MAKGKQVKGGLLELPFDHRDLRLGDITTQPLLTDLPEEFTLGEALIKDQGSDDKCTAHATGGMSEFQEDVELDPEFIFAASKSLSNDPEEWGQDLRTALKTHVKIGALAKADSPEVNKSVSRYLDKWPEKDALLEKAKIHRKESYAFVDGQYDHFDNIRCALWQFRAEKRAVGLGLKWGQNWRSAVIPDENPKTGFGHMVYAVGWKKIDGEIYLKIANSQGRNFGDNGYNYLPRRVVNYYVGKFGTGMFIDLPQETAKLIIKQKENIMAEPSIKYKFNSDEGNKVFKSLLISLGGYVLIQVVETLAQFDFGTFNAFAAAMAPFIVNTVRIWMQGK